MNDYIFFVAMVFYGLCFIGLIQILCVICIGLAKIFISYYENKQYQQLRQEFLDYPTEMVDHNGKIFYPRYRKS
jgi:hypothetical protein